MTKYSPELQKALAKVLQVKAAHEDELLKLPGVHTSNRLSVARAGSVQMTVVKNRSSASYHVPSARSKNARTSLLRWPLKTLAIWTGYRGYTYWLA